MYIDKLTDFVFYEYMHTLVFLSACKQDISVDFECESVAAGFIMYVFVLALFHWSTFGNNTSSHACTSKQGKRLIGWSKQCSHQKIFKNQLCNVLLANKYQAGLFDLFFPPCHTDCWKYEQVTVPWAQNNSRRIHLFLTEKGFWGSLVVQTAWCRPCSSLRL